MLGLNKFIQVLENTSKSRSGVQTCAELNFHRDATCEALLFPY